VAIAAGAIGKEIDLVAKIMIDEGVIKLEKAKEILYKIRGLE